MEGEESGSGPSNYSNRSFGRCRLHSLGAADAESAGDGLQQRCVLRRLRAASSPRTVVIELIAGSVELVDQTSDLYPHLRDFIRMAIGRTEVCGVSGFLGHPSDEPVNSVYSLGELDNLPAVAIVCLSRTVDLVQRSDAGLELPDPEHRFAI
jgi:hypothetical protein